MKRIARLLSTQKECILERMGDISVLTLNRPSTKNALGTTLLNELDQSIREVKFSKARVLVIKSQVPKVFCSGADLKERRGMSPEQVAKFVDSLRTCFSDLERIPIPTIACIDGYALGGGLELALACDIRIAGKDAKMGLVETKLAIIPGAGGTQRLARLIGASKAKELIYTAKVLDSSSALAYGIVNHSVPDSVSFGLNMANEIVRNGPIAIRMAKAAIDYGLECDTRTGMAFEQQCYAQVIETKDRIEGLNAFREKRDPVYKGE